MNFIKRSRVRAETKKIVLNSNQAELCPNTAYLRIKKHRYLGVSQ